MAMARLTSRTCYFHWSQHALHPRATCHPELFLSGIQSRGSLRRASTYLLNTETVSYLANDKSDREVYLVGTAHVSERSAEDVRRAIEYVQPDCVMLELCEKRAQRIRADKDGSSSEELMRKLLREGPSGRPFSEWMLKVGFSGVYALMRQFGLMPGLEFKVALAEAESRGLQTCFADRDVDETMQLLHAALPSLYRAASAPPPMSRELEELVGDLSIFKLSKTVEKLKNRRHIRLFRDHMAQAMPDFMDILVHQRDALMTDRLLNECKPGRIVAVVGMAHMDGIETEWQRRGGEIFLHTDNSLKSHRS